MGLVATLREGLSAGFESLTANKIRSGLTILGVTIGVLVVMVMAAVIEGINGSFTEAISAGGPTTFYVMHAKLGGGINTGLEEEESEWLRNPPLVPAWVSDLGRLPGISDVSAMADLSSSGYKAVAGRNTVRIALRAVGSDYMEIDGGDLADGRFFTATEDRRRRAVVVIDSLAAHDLFAGLDPLGRRILLTDARGTRTAPFTVIGVYRPPANLFAALQNHYVWIPFSAAEKELGFWDRLVSFIVRPAPNTPRAVALDAVHARMRQLRGLRPAEADNFALITQDEIFDLWKKLTGALFAVMVALSGVGLLVGGVGVIGIMMISVTERTREIGVRMATGARRRDILWQFLVEAATLTLLGGAIGLAIGGALVLVLNHLTPIPASVPPWSIAVALLASVFTGIGFGLYPAARGARLDPVEALRYE